MVQKWCGNSKHLSLSMIVFVVRSPKRTWLMCWSLLLINMLRYLQYLSNKKPVLLFKSSSSFNDMNNLTPSSFLIVRVSINQLRSTKTVDQLTFSSWRSRHRLHIWYHWVFWKEFGIQYVLLYTTLVIIWYWTYYCH